MAPPRPAKYPRPLPALVIDASPSLRAVIYGRAGHVTLIRSNTAFTVTDLEASKIEHARRVHRGEETADG